MQTLSSYSFSSCHFVATKMLSSVSSPICDHRVLSVAFCILQFSFITVNLSSFVFPFACALYQTVALAQLSELFDLESIYTVQTHVIVDSLLQ